MIAFLEGGNATESMLLFDPAVFPDDFDEHRDDLTATIERLAEAGAIIRFDAPSDEGTTLGVRDDGGPPGDTARFARVVAETERLDVPSGRLVFSGVEYAFRFDDSDLLGNYPEGASCAIAPGRYRLRLYAMGYPDDFIEERLRPRLSPSALRIHALMGTLAPLGCLGVAFLALGFSIVGSLRVWAVGLLPFGLAMVLPGVLLSRTASYREARRLEDEVRREHPHFWAILGDPGGSWKSRLVNAKP